MPMPPPPRHVISQVTHVRLYLQFSAFGEKKIPLYVYLKLCVVNSVQGEKTAMWKDAFGGGVAASKRNSHCRYWKLYSRSTICVISTWTKFFFNKELLIGYHNIHLTYSSYSPLWTLTRLQPLHLMDQFSTVTDEFYYICRHFMHKFNVFNNRYVFLYMFLCYSVTPWG